MRHSAKRVRFKKFHFAENLILNKISYAVVLIVLIVIASALLNSFHLAMCSF